MGGDVSDDLCKRNSRGEENGKARQQVTSDDSGRVRGQTGEK